MLKLPPPCYATPQLEANARRKLPEPTGFYRRDLDPPRGTRPSFCCAFNEAEMKRCHEQTCGRVSEFAIRTNAITCLSELRVVLMGFHLFLLSVFFSPCDFLFIPFVNKYQAD